MAELIRCLSENELDNNVGKVGIKNEKQCNMKFERT